MSPEVFLQQWQSFVARWADAERTEKGSGAHLIDGLLEHGLAHQDGEAPTTAPSETDLMACEIEVVRRSGAVDVAAYLGTDPPLKPRDGDAVRHFCQRGRTLLRNPSLDFDLWWYLGEHLDGDVDGINPLLHHVLVGRFVGLPTRPEPLTENVPAPLGASGAVRRACLVVGADPDGLVAPHVVRFVRELGRFGDVFYLGRQPLLDGELEKLDGLVVESWEQRVDDSATAKGAILARDLVGWDTLEQYDEVVIVDDDHYLVRPLDEVFATMDERACDWWALRVTSPRFLGEGPDREPIGVDEAKRRYLKPSSIRANETLTRDMAITAFRAPVVADPGFRRVMERMIPRTGSTRMTRRHDLGLTRYLAARGYELGVHDDVLRPNDQPFGPTGFELVESGRYPLLSRSYLVNNPDRIPDFARWRVRLGAWVPGDVLDEIEAHLVRVSSDASLQRSFAIVTREDGTVDFHDPMTPEEFQVVDETVPKYDHWWAFPVCAYDHTFAGNERAVFDEIRDDPSIKKIILTKSRRIDVTGENVVIVPIESPEAQYYLARSRFVFVKHTLTGNVPWPMSAITHDVINLWHGIPLKRFGMASAGLDEETRQTLMTKHGYSRAVIVSSRMDALAMSAAFFPVSYPDMWPTGLPRNDFVTRPEEQLPDDFRAMAQRLRDEVAGRRLVMFLPTFRDGQGESQYQFDESELARLAKWAERHNAVIGVREHMADRGRTYSRALMPLGAIDLSAHRYPDLEILYREADALISDYSSCLVDFLLTGKPVMSFAYDYERYSNAERGLFYQLDRVLPGPVCRSFEDLAAALDTVFDPLTPEQAEEYDWKRRIFFDHLDDQASWRVVQRVKGLYLDEQRS
ncbi:CDP-glycerol glycerophosphotransferase family protein [Aeromicrobium chenweiae]|uniref:Uncharacterized protein n=1 Tax=Aeromicrobium chenweiae TaxID=2079793 RepID=A0A2S0WK60_9ACTN|nr:CDP-glycerol glycerophosphotransferase family protein [Aeromicrobium chenweiae]AWB91726.1 hypothetical protein C3E78_05615 [Aeromicrobium chenweiae]TGN32567.1 hypothetical protein E4L97_07575 [Aeromicrobium chenweiae]